MKPLCRSFLQRALAWAGVCALLIGLSGCGTSRIHGELMVKDPHPVTKIWVLNALGTLPAYQVGPKVSEYWQGPFRNAMQTRFGDVLAANGVEVSNRLVLSRSPKSLKEMQTLWDSMPDKQAGVSHVLVLTAQRTVETRDFRGVEFETVLWEPATGRLVWQGHPQFGTGSQKHPLNASENIARYLLKQWKDAALIKLSGAPKNLQGKEIGWTFDWNEDK